MPTITEGRLSLSFKPRFDVQPYDRWRHYRQKRQPKPLEEKAVDVVAYERRSPPRCLWLIEVKDFRHLSGEPKEKNERDNLSHNTVRKAADTLVGLRDAAVNAELTGERMFAEKAIIRTPKRVVLHFEPFPGPKKLFPEQPSPANVLQKMKQLLRSHPELHPDPLVLSMRTIDRFRKNEPIPWSVADVP